MFTFNTQPSPLDARDWKAESIFSSEQPLPKTLDLRPFINAVRNQGSRGTCASFACSCIKEYHERIDTGTRRGPTVQKAEKGPTTHKAKKGATGRPSVFDGYMSPESIYFHRSNKPGAGMFGRDAMSILQKIGSCPEEEFPYNRSGPEPEKEPETIHQRFKIESYAQVQTIDGLKRALLNSGPCYVSFPVYKTRPEFWRPSEPKEELIGGHAVAAVGYNKTGFIIRNSWGESWNSDGHVIYPYSDWGAHWEIWTTVDEKSSIYIAPPPTCATLLFKLFKKIFRRN